MSLDQFFEAPADECKEPGHRIVAGIWYHEIIVEGLKGLELCDKRNQK